MFQRRINFLFRTASNILQKRRCPYCGNEELQKIAKKFRIISLFKCDHCGLNHRHPRDSKRFLKHFYNNTYSISQELITNLPDDSHLEELKSNNFQHHRNYDPYIQILNPSIKKILDYGCSWGYSVYKLKNAGYDVCGLELGVNRANFGMEKLDVKIYTNESNLPDNLDLFMSSHVIEHLSDLKSFFELACKSLTSEGYFLAFCPNGNSEYRKREPRTWQGSWGDIHVNLIDRAFYQHVFRNNPYLILSDDWSYNKQALSEWDGRSQIVGNKLDGKELLVISKPNIQLS